MAGFLAVLVPVLSLGLGGVELAHWMSLRQALSLALMDAARAGITRQASPQAIADAFEQGLRVIHARPDARARALQARRHDLGAPWQIRIRQPAPVAFLDHADAGLSAPGRHPVRALIRNDYQAAQHARRIGQGWPQGRGPRSGLTIYEANTLLMDLWWPQAPMAPGVPALLRVLAPLHKDPVGRRMMESGYLPFRRSIRLAMQSHPALWPDLPDGRVVHDLPAAGPDQALPGAPGGTPAGGENTAPVSPDTPAATEPPPITSPNDGRPPDAPSPPPEPPGGMPDACAP